MRVSLRAFLWVWAHRNTTWLLQLGGFSGGSPRESSYLSSRLGLEAGWQVIDYQLALHGGLEHTYLLPIEDTDTKFSYTSLTLGASYYFSFEKLFGGMLKTLSPLYISPQIRLPLQASFQTKYSLGGQEAIVEPPLEGDGIGFGFSLGKEWYASDRLLYGVALTYTRDSFKSPSKNVQSSVSAGAGTGTGTTTLDIELRDTKSSLEYMGILFTIAFD